MAWHGMVKQKGNAELRVTLKLQTMKCRDLRWA